MYLLTVAEPINSHAHWYMGYFFSALLISKCLQLLLDVYNLLHHLVQWSFFLFWKASDRFVIQHMTVTWHPCSVFLNQDGRIDYGEFVAMMTKGNMGVGRRTMRNSLNISMRDAPGALWSLKRTSKKCGRTGCSLRRASCSATRTLPTNFLLLFVVAIVGVCFRNSGYCWVTPVITSVKCVKNYHALVRLQMFI